MTTLVLSPHISNTCSRLAGFMQKDQVHEVLGWFRERGEVLPSVGRRWMQMQILDADLNTDLLHIACMLCFRTLCQTADTSA